MLPFHGPPIRSACQSDAYITHLHAASALTPSTHRKTKASAASVQLINSSITPRHSTSTLQSSDPRAPAMTAVRGIGGGRVRRGRAILALLLGDGGRVPRGYVPMVLVGDGEERRIMVRVRRDAQARSHGGRSGDGRAAVPSFAGSPAAPAGSSRCSAWRAKLDRSR